MSKLVKKKSIIDIQPLANFLIWLVYRIVFLSLQLIKATVRIIPREKLFVLGIHKEAYNRTFYDKDIDIQSRTLMVEYNLEYDTQTQKDKLDFYKIKKIKHTIILGNKNTSLLKD